MRVLAPDRAVRHSGSPDRPRRRARLLIVLAVVALVATGAIVVAAGHLPSTEQAATNKVYQVPVVIGAVPYWDEQDARTSIQTQAGKLTVTSPWIYAAAADGSVQLQPGVDAAGEQSQTTWLHDRGLKVVPTIADTSAGLWDPATVSTLIGDPTLRAAHVRAVVALATTDDYDGIQIDYEDLAAADRASFSEFVTDLAGALHAAGKLLYVTVHAKEDDAGYDQRNEAQDYAAIGQAADMVCVMAYDWHWSTSAAGPIAPYDWVQRVIDYAVTQIPASKLILGVGLFGYDWVGSSGQSLTWDQVVALADKYRTAEQWDVGSQSPHLSYTDASGQQHDVWYEDARSVQAKFDLARRAELGGIELWRLGGEDPGIWDPSP